MKRSSITGFAGLAVVFLLAACAATPAARFYTLNAASPSAPAHAANLSLLLGPIDLPEYLDRPHIVTRIGDNRLHVDEFNRWGGSLEEEIGRVLTSFLGDRLGTRRIFSYPSRIVAPADYRIALDVRRFDGVPGGEVELDVAWSLLDDRTGAVLQTRRGLYRSHVNGPDYASYAAALGGLLVQLGNDLVAVLVELPPPRL